MKHEIQSQATKQALAAPEGATVRGPQAEFGGRVRISRANKTGNPCVSEKGKLVLFPFVYIIIYSFRPRA